MEAARYQLLIQADVQPAYRLLILWQWTATGKRPATADPVCSASLLSLHDADLLPAGHIDRMASEILLF